MKELRDIKLDLLLGNDNEIINLFNKITTGIEIINCDVYNEDGLEFIYHKDGEWIFYQDAKNKKFWANYYSYWTHFEAFDLSYEDVQEVTKFLVEEALKREVATPFYSVGVEIPVVEEALKKEVSTPTTSENFSHFKIEEALKKLDTLPTTNTSRNKEIKEALKREVVTPNVDARLIEKEVEEALKKELSKYILDSEPDITNSITIKEIQNILKKELK